MPRAPKKVSYITCRFATAAEPSGPFAAVKWFGTIGRSCYVEGIIECSSSMRNPTIELLRTRAVEEVRLPGREVLVCIERVQVGKEDVARGGSGILNRASYDGNHFSFDLDLLSRTCILSNKGFVFFCGEVRRGE